MPYLIRRPRARRFLSTLIAATAAVTLLPAAASAKVTQCTVSASGQTQEFASFGDSSWYTLAPNGAFASGSSGWTLSSSYVQGGEGGFAHSLVVGAGGTAISAPFCVSSLTPTFRFFQRQVGSGWSEMNVYILWTAPNGSAQFTCVGSVQPNGTWLPSSVYGLGQILPTEDGSSFSVRAEFIPAAGGSPVAIYGLYVDPYSRG